MSAAVLQLPGNKSHLLSARLQRAGRLNRSAAVLFMAFEVLAIAAVAALIEAGPAEEPLQAAGFVGFMIAYLGLPSAVVCAGIWMIQGFLTEDVLARRYTKAAAQAALRMSWAGQLFLSAANAAAILFPFVGVGAALVFGFASS